MTEFTVSIANRPGRLADLAEALGEAGINIEALAAFGNDGEAVIHMMTDDEPTTRAVLRRMGVRFTERAVLTTVLPHRPGALAALTRQLADANINIEAVYLLRSRPDGLEFALAVDAIDDARSRLAS